MLKKVFSAWVICALIFSFNVVGGFSVIWVQAIDNADIERVKKENQIENYDLKRVLAIREGKIRYVLEYEHQKTGARFVCAKDYDYADCDVSVFYKIASEDSTGAVHALEHCIYNDMLFEPEDDLEFASKAFTLPVGVFFSAPNVLKNGGCCANDVVNMINALKNPKFLSDENVFKSQVFNQTSAKDAKSQVGGRVFIEIEQKNHYEMPAQTRAICDNLIMNSNNKFKFYAGGIPEEICNCSYEKVCDLYRKYIHPSNMAVLIQGENFREVMRQFHENYMNGFEKKDIVVDYTLQNEDMGSFFKEYDVGGINAALCKQENYKYCAIAAYPLKSVKNCDIHNFENMCCIFGDPEFKKYLLKLGYEDANASIGLSPDCDYLKIAVMGNDSKKFDEKSLSLNFNKILSKATETDKVTGFYLRSGFGIPHDPVAGRLFWSYALCGDLFNDRFFTIKENEIYYDGANDASRINKDLAQKFTKKPAEIVLLKDNGSWKREDFFINKFKLTFCENDLGKVQLAMRILNRGLVSKELQERGAVYNDLFVNYGASDGDSSCFCSTGSVTFDNIIDFFENDFAKKVKNFEVSDELFNLVKSNIINNKLYLQGVHSYSQETAVKDDFLLNSNVANISKDEIQEFIKTARFVGYAVAK